MWDVVQEGWIFGGYSLAVWRTEAAWPERKSLVAGVRKNLQLLLLVMFRDACEGRESRVWKVFGIWRIHS
jgi:hypothetical protein